MEFKKPKAKKGVIAPNRENRENLPLGETPITGVFNGFHVVISDAESMSRIYQNGNFGKGNLSKSHPQYKTKKDDLPKVIWKQQFDIESKWASEVSVPSDDSYWNHQIELSAKSISDFFHSIWQCYHSDSSTSWKQVKMMAADRSANNESSKMIEETIHVVKGNVPWVESKETYPIDEKFSSTVNEILEKRQLRKMKASHPDYKNETVIVIDADCTQDSSINVSLDNISATLEKRPFPITESLTLNLEESFFLCFALGVLKIVDMKGNELSVDDLWSIFTSLNDNFFERYVIYHYYRSKGWVVQSGLKYGGDYLLYKIGPAYYHASYVVKIVKNGNGGTSWNEFIATNRLVETFNKDVLFCSVVKECPSLKAVSLLEELKNCKVVEILSRRGLCNLDLDSK